MKYLKNYNTFILENSNNNLNKKIKSFVDSNIPEMVDGDIEYEGVGLISLDGSPKEVSGDFNCSDNKLTSLKGCPKKVGGIFWCNDNQLKNLDYLPEYIGRYLVCYGNDWEKPIPYKILFKYNFLSFNDKQKILFNIYTQEQFDEFSSFDFQKEFLEREPENYLDLKLFGYAEGIEELFPHLFDMDELGLID